MTTGMSTIEARSTLERPRYFPRQVVTADELTLEQNYFRDRMRRHNRMFHGWGVVCGATLACPPQSKAWHVIVGAGFVLDPCGDEILIERNVCFDLRTRCMSGPDPQQDPCGTPEDPAPPTGDLYVAVRYRETKSRPVRVHASGCGCEQNPCEYSRWRDGYELCVLDQCPPSHVGPPPPTVELLLKKLDCLPPTSERWVVLGKLTVSAEGEIASIAPCDCRRQVASLAGLWWACTDPARPCGPAPNP